MSFVKKHAAFAAALFGLLFTVAAFNGGFLTVDSIGQLREARIGNYSDWHPPMMAWVWSFFDRIVTGSVGMLVFHNLLFWSGLGLIVALTTQGLAFSILSVFLIGFNPAILGILSTIWKDVGLGAGLLFSFSLLLYSDRKKSKGALAAAFPVLFYSAAVRHNSTMAVLPLTLWAGFISGGIFLKKKSPPRSLLLGLGIFLAIYAGVHLANRALVQGRFTYPIQQIWVHDLAAVSIANQQNYLPAYTYYPGPSFSTEHLKMLYTRDEIVSLFCCGEGIQRIPLTKDPANIAELKETWFRVIGGHLGPYFMHRLRVFGSQLGIHRPHVCNPFAFGVVENDLGLGFQSSRLNQRVMGVLFFFRDSLLFRGWFYLFFLSVCLFSNLFVFRRNVLEVTVLIASGLGYFLPYFFVGTTCDFRMHWWSVIAAMVSPLLVFSLDESSR